MTDDPAIVEKIKAVLWIAPMPFIRVNTEAELPHEVCCYGPDGEIIVMGACRRSGDVDSIRREMTALLQARYIAKAIHPLIPTELATVPVKPFQSELITDRVRRVNEVGAGKAGIGYERLKDFRVYPESGKVQVWIEVRDFPSRGGDVIEVLQYLTAEEAMAFAKAFERCAIQALKDGCV